MQWRRRDADPKELEALHPGVPSWMRRYVVAWAKTIAYMDNPDGYGPPVPDVSYILEYETAVRRPITLEPKFRSYGMDRLLDEMGGDEFLDFVDFLLFKASERPSKQSESLKLLEAILSSAGSEWKVGVRDGHAALEKRVPEGVVEAAHTAMSSSGSAGPLLAEAWHAAFGKSPDTEEAYEKAIKAVEEAGAAVVSPKNRVATLGTMIRDMKAQSDWRLDLPTPHADAPIKMAEALWTGQESRHGGNAYRKPTQSEAEAAVMLAVPLVQWFSSGAVQRRPATGGLTEHD